MAEVVELSQEEIDALIAQMGGEAADVLTKAGKQKEADVSPLLTAAAEEKVNTGRLPAIDIINDRFTTNLRFGLFNYVRRGINVSVDPAHMIKYRDFIGNLSVPNNINVMRAHPLEGLMLIVIDPTLIMTTIDNLFGGGGKKAARIEGREFSMLERKVIDAILKIIQETYAQAWSAYYPLSFEFLRSEVNTQYVNVAAMGEPVIVSEFGVRIGNEGGTIHVCIPFATLTPIRDVIYTYRNPENEHAYKRWHSQFREEFESVEVELSVPLTSVDVDLSQLMQLKKGDVIPVDIPDSLNLEVENLPMFSCRFGRKQENYAVRVEDAIWRTQELEGMS